MERKGIIVLKSKIGLEFSKALTLRWKLIALGKLLESITKFQHKSQPDEGLLKLLDKRKEAKLQ
jgi:hypothetical protein